MAKPDRPSRRTIPIAVKRAIVRRQRGVCICGCGQAVSELQRTNTHFDHEPALILRAINRAGTDYIPPQHSARHIDARCPASHDRKTRGSGATTAGTDRGKMKKADRRSRKPKPKRQWPKGRKLGSRPMRSRR